MRFTERYPNYCDYGPPLEFTVNSLAELHVLPRVKDVMEWSDFYRLSVTPIEELGYPSRRRRLLMAETKNGYSWWAIGWLDEPLDEEWVKVLPDWEAKYTDV